MTRNGYRLAAALLAVGLVTTACGRSGDSSTTVTETVPASTTSTTVGATPTTSSATATTITSGSADLQSLIPTPANSQRTDGPEAIKENGIHKHFLVSGSPKDVMDAYKAALEGAGWSVVVEHAGGGGGGGGATYTGTNGGAYGVFVGGGFGNTTDVNSCAWPSKPSNTNGGNSCRVSPLSPCPRRRARGCPARPPRRRLPGPPPHRTPSRAPPQYLPGSAAPATRRAP